MWKHFLVAFALSLLLPALFSVSKIGFFIPVMVLAFYQRSRLFCLYFSFLCGLLLDVLASDFEHLGIFSLNYVLVSFFLYDKKQLLFRDSIWTYPIMGTAFSFFSTLIGALLVSFFEKKWVPAYNLEWIFTDFIFMSLLDGLYTLAFLVLPAYIPLLLPKRKKRYSHKRPS